MDIVKVREILEVSFILAVAAATLFGVIVPGSPNGLDVLNDPNARPIPGGITQLGGRREACKGDVFSFRRRFLRSFNRPSDASRRSLTAPDGQGAREESSPRRLIAASSQTG